MKRILAVMLLLLMTAGLFGCQKEEVKNEIPTEYSEIGQGEREFMFCVTGKDGETESFLIHTDKKFVGEALLALEII